MHFVCFPASLISSAVFPEKITLAFKLIMYKLSFIVAVIRPRKFTSFLMTSLKKASKYGTIRPILLSYAVLFIIDPLSSVKNSLIMPKLSKSMCGITFPRSKVVIFIWMNVKSFFAELVILEAAIIISSIRKVNFSEPL